jgi:aminoglycoside phosphotransferase (APT) family kinase protein
MLHTGAWWLAVGDEPGLPWCPLPERLSLLSRPAAVGYAAAGNPVGERFLAGWDAFDRLAPASTRGLVDRLAADPARLVAALAGLPSIGLHGDLKLANVAVFPDGGIGLIDWQMVVLGPTALELGWLLVSNSAVLPLEPMEVLRRYRDSVGRYVGRRGVAEGAPRTLEEVIGEPATHDDLAIIVGLVLRGWRKGLDAEAGLTLPAGVTAVDDLAWWSRRAVEAAERRLA